MIVNGRDLLVGPWAWTGGNLPDVGDIVVNKETRQTFIVRQAPEDVDGLDLEEQ